jgi:hypothetical protein
MGSQKASGPASMMVRGQQFRETPNDVLALREPCAETEPHDFAALRPAKFKLPKKCEFLNEPLRKGGRGKILKKELREKFWR